MTVERTRLLRLRSLIAAQAADQQKRSLLIESLATDAPNLTYSGQLHRRYELERALADVERQLIRRAGTIAGLRSYDEPAVSEA
jgi:hypothetical protein